MKRVFLIVLISAIVAAFLSSGCAGISPYSISTGKNIGDDGGGGDDTVPSVKFTSATQNGAEDVGAITVTAELSDASDRDVTVPFDVGGTVTDDDYSLTASPIIIAAGATTADITITIRDDALDEADETIIVTMGDPTNATKGETTVYTVTITDNDPAPTVTLGLADSPLDEDGGVATVTATLSAVSGLPVTVNLGFAGTAELDDDYSLSGEQIVIAAGDLAGAITITGKDDLLDEDDETVTVDINAVINGTEEDQQQVIATITDDDDLDAIPSVALGLANSPLAENGGVATVTATLSAASSLPVTVNLGFAGTATLADDYSLSGEQIIIAAGSLSNSITITGEDDTLDEVDETVIVDITGVTNGTENGVQQVTATITDDDAAPTVTLGLANSPLAENGGVATVTATLSAASSLPVTVNLGFAGTATLADDYSLSGEQIIIAAGSLSNSITITGADDILDEDDETVVVDITGVTNGTENGVQQVTATITDDDAPPTVALGLAGSPLDEDGGVATVTATLSAASSLPVTVNLGFAGTATLTDDYSLSGEQIIIAAGSLSNSITITGADDILDEDDETVVVDITGVTNGTENGVQQVTAIITDDDATPSVAFTSAAQNRAENIGAMTVTAELSDASGRDVTVPFVVGGTATGGGTDYTITASPITINKGSTTATITITVIDDALDEDDETVIVTMGAPTNANQGAITVHTATITDNDESPPLAPSGVTVEVGSNCNDLVITWDDVEGATSYNIYFDTSTGVTKETGTKIEGAVSPYTHTSLDVGETYYYVVTAVNAAGEGEESEEKNNETTPVNPVGDLDTTFNTVGYLYLDDTITEGSSVKIDSSGRLLVVGTVWNGANGYDIAVWRYNRDGTPDNTFDDDGVVMVHSASGGNWEFGNGMVLDDSGRILVAARSSKSGNFSDIMTVLRFNEDGSLDDTFGGDGIVTYDTGLGTGVAEDIIVNSDNRIIVVGNSTVFALANPDLTVLVYDDTGALLDSTSYNAAGGGGGSGLGVALDASGRIFVAGSVDIDIAAGDSSDIVLLCYELIDDELSLDGDFSGDGVVSDDESNNDQGTDVAIDADGKILVSGYTLNEAIAMRLDSSGDLDATFAAGGKLYYGNDTEFDSLSLDGNARILASGYEGNIFEGTMFLLRLDGTGTLDETFSLDGIVTFANPNFDPTADIPLSVTNDECGRIVLTGSTDTYPSRRMMIWRYE